MDYVLGLKNEIRVLDEVKAKEKYRELLAMGYSENDILFATPAPVQNYFNERSTDISQPNYNQVKENEEEVAIDTTGTQYTNVSGLNPGGDELPSDTLS